jgi:DNA helicase II / ATP-dependent DNA helicase PcrA
VPGRGIGAKSAEELGRFARERGLALTAAVAAREARELVKGRARAGLAEFAALLERLAPLAGGPAASALEGVLAATDYQTRLSEAGEPDVRSRLENVEELLSGARLYDEDHPGGGLRGYLEEVALVSDVDAYEEDSPRVTLMTLHASKGLEFPCVHIAGLEEGLLPHARALEEDPLGGLEEERRLLYVGMTRAMDELALTHARVRFHFGASTPQTPSRFLAEIPLEWTELAVDSALEVHDGPRYVADEPDGEELEPGARVEHDHFGYGVVELVQGRGGNARLTVRFAGAGTRVLLAQYAKLRRVR